LLDLYTIRKELAAKNKSIDGLSISLIGDLRFGRAVHSLCKLLSLFKHIQFNLISPPELSLPDEYIVAMRDAGHNVNQSTELQPNISSADILYVTRTQEERFPNQEEANKYKGLFRLNQAVYTQFCEPNTVIMHPLPRDSREAANELDNDLNENPNLAIFRQTDNGVTIRMALFALILDVVNQVDAHAKPVNWYTAKRF